MNLYTKDYDIACDGKQDVTKLLQQLIDYASKNNQTFVLNKGVYLVSSLFLKSNLKFVFEEGAVLLATTDEEKYPLIQTRVAGIDMEWYPAVLNVIECQNVEISGKGTIDGNGPYWWRKYWGVDSLGGMRHEYDRIGLRWACDYDCLRPRNLLIQSSKNVKVSDLISYRSGFWNIHVLYSSDCIVSGVTIDAHGPIAPSTDGIDIDSSNSVTIENCNISCNDDSICIKSGRGLEAFEKGISCRNIHINDCNLSEGFGITIGSEVSGGIENVFIKNIKMKNTSCGLRIKSSYDRKGYIKNVFVEDVEMINVKYAFHIFTDWNRNYSICELPKNYSGEIKPHYEKLLSRINDKERNTQIENLSVFNLTSTYSEDYTGICRLFHVVGFVDEPIKNITFDNVHLKGKEKGIIKNVVDINTTNCSYKYLYELDNDLEFDNR